MSTKKNNSYHHGDLKATLLKAANRLLADKGVDALSLRSIATEVGVSHMAPYAHFKNKSELFKAVAANGFKQLAERLEQIHWKSNKSNELVLLYGVAYIKFATNHPQLYKLMLNQTNPSQSPNTDSDQNLLSISENTLREASRKPYTLLREGFAQNESDDNKVKIQAQGAWALVHGLASLLITGQIVIDNESSIKEFLATATQGMSA